MQSHGDAGNAFDGSTADDIGPSPAESIVNVDSLPATLAAKDEELAAKDEELAAKDEELAAKDVKLAANFKELEELRAQLMRLEGVPPTGKD